MQEEIDILLCDSNEPDSFAALLLKLLKSKELRQSMSEKGWDFVSQRFSYLRLVEDMRQLYHRLLP